MENSSEYKQRDIDADWQKNWGSSIAIKITAPVLWTLIFFGMLVAILVQHSESTVLEAEFSSEADQLAYNATHYLMRHDGSQFQGLIPVLENAMQDMKFTRGQIKINSRQLTFGYDQGDQASVKLTREILYSSLSDTENAHLAKLELFHPPLDVIIKKHRKEILLKIGIPFFIFGLLLARLIHVIVTRPIFELVNATKAISEGDINMRINTQRTDEFGHLSAFFNQMLDKLQAKQDELSAAVRQAESANNMKSSFLANMSHEIRTPLTAIIGYSELLKQEEQTEEEREEEIDSIQRAGHHLLEVINDILDLSKIEAGELVIESLWISPMEVLKEVEGLVSLRAESKGLNFSVKYEYPLPDLIYTDPTRLRQILLNLCSNAVKFTDEGSVSVRVSYLAQQQLLQFDVTDSGIGISDNEMERLFRPFSQADTSTTRQYGGTGLGLAISKQLAERLGGDIQCSSHKWIGSKFTLTVASGEIHKEGIILETPKPVSQVKEARRVKTSQMLLCGRVLLAEDTPDNQMLISMYIRRTGAEVTVVENGKLAIDHALTEDFDLILMDMQMPVMDGVTATQRLRDAGYDKPIVALTANALQQDKDECERAGSDDYLTKPLDMPNFYAVLHRYLNANTVSTDPNIGSVAGDEAGSHVNTTVENSERGVTHSEAAEFQYLRKQFIVDLPVIISELRLLFDGQEWVELQSRVRQLKGKALSYRIDNLVNYAEQIQTRLEEGETENIQQHLQALIKCCETILEEDQLKQSSGAG